MDWTAVAQGTGLNFARESTALTLQRAAERVAKPRVRHPLHPAEIPRLLGDKLPVLAKPLAQRPVPQGPVAASACTSQVSPAAHREMIKHLPKMARRHYLSAAADSGSKWRAGASTSLAVLRRPSMAKGLARSRPTRPPATPEARSALLGAAGREERPRRAAAEAEAAAAPSCGASARSRRARRLRPTQEPILLHIAFELRPGCRRGRRRYACGVRHSEQARLPAERDAQAAQARPQLRLLHRRRCAAGPPRGRPRHRPRPRHRHRSRPRLPPRAAPWPMMRAVRWQAACCR